MIVKNESATLERCLNSASSLADEIIVVDTGSDDDTREIAKRFTDKVYDFEWTDDFSAARNFSFSKANSDYIMWLDADDVIPANSISVLKELKNTILGDINAVFMPYAVSFDVQGNCSMKYYRERWLRRAAGFMWAEPVHEAIAVSGKHIYFDGAVIEHRKIKESATGRNLKIIEKQIERGPISPRMKFYYGRELMFAGRTEDAAAVFREFLADKNGWQENSLTACLDLSRCLEDLGDEKGALESAFEGFLYAPPRAEHLCRIGELFLKAKRLNEAEYWYLRALETPFPAESGGFVDVDCYGFLPAIQLTVIYDRMGKKELAESYNEKAGAYKPQSPAYLYNKDYFAKLNENQ